MTETTGQTVPQIRRGRARGQGWTPVTRGIHRPAAADSLEADLKAWRALLRPTACFTHLTSVRLRSWWLPPLPDWLPVFICMSSAQNAPIRPGLDVTRQIVASPSELRSGLPVAVPEETIIACADDLGVLDLVVIIDCALRRGEVTIDKLWTVARQHRRGGPRLREALSYVDARSESAWESLLRVLHVVCGVRVEPQRDIVDASGVHVARADLWLTGTTSLHEYDGAHHLTRDQQRSDLRRSRRVVDAGLIRRGYTSDDVLHRAVTILRDADTALGRPHDPTRIRPWTAMLHQSLFTSAGQARLRRRLRVDRKIDGSGA